MKVTISGSYRKFADHLKQDLDAFADFGVQVLSPQSASIVAYRSGFVSLKGDLVPRIDHVAESALQKALACVEDSHLRAITHSDVLWLILPHGYCGPATSLEMGWALANRVPIYARMEQFLSSKEPMVKAYVNPVTSVEHLIASYDPSAGNVDLRTSQNMLYSIAEKLQGNYFKILNAVVAVGAMIVNEDKDLLFVQTHKWGGRYSIVGGRVRKGEDLGLGLLREVKEETGLYGRRGKILCAFNEIRDSGYYLSGTSRIFIDHVVEVLGKDVQLNHEAEDYVWLPPEESLQLDLEPNARVTLEHYMAA